MPGSRIPRSTPVSAFGHGPFTELWAELELSLFEEPSREDLFNMYRDVHPSWDRTDAAQIRRHNLRSYLGAYRAAPEFLLLAEAPGPWGCRFSGVPITSEAQLVEPGFPFRGEVSALDGVPHQEYSAGIFWRTLQTAFPRFFVWNSVPLHPHAEGRPLTIRTPRPEELRRYESLTRTVIEIVRPTTILAVGRKAEGVLARIEVPSTYVRHPSQGGASHFALGVLDALAKIESHDG